MALKNIIGQDRAVGILLRTLHRGRLPSAYLFSGESGIGKRVTAVNLAKAVNCLEAFHSRQLPNGGGEDAQKRHEGPPADDFRLADACDRCHSCKKIDAETHPDLIVMTPEKGEIRVDQIRAVEDALSYMPYEGRRKVVVIDDADTMNQSAANAFLKTLEEPSAESLIVLISSNPDQLPETIRSRCSRIHFTPLSVEACREVIQAVNSQHLTVDGGDRKRPATVNHELSTVIRLSMGRPGLAVSSEPLKERERFLSLLRNMVEGDSEIWADREEMERWLDMAGIFLRDMAVGKITDDEGALFNADIQKTLLGMSKATDIQSILKAYRSIIQLKGKLDFNLNKSITWNYTASLLRAAVSNV
ncbi:MAG: DNA polymerase III subunit delta' [Thermodesulfovibrionales bacterium]|jgi:DNA polymerase-3 subunit delta'